MKNYNLSNLDVLVVENHGYMRLIIRDILQTLGIRKIHEATNESEALEIFREEKINMVLTDWSATVDGLFLLHKIRDTKESPNPYVPVLILSTKTELRHIIQARDKGATEFLAKPIVAKLIYSHICSVIEHGRPFVRSSDFFGPDRRRRRLGPPKGERRDKAPEVRHGGRVATAI